MLLRQVTYNLYFLVMFDQSDPWKDPNAFASVLLFHHLHQGFQVLKIAF